MQPSLSLLFNKFKVLIAVYIHKYTYTFLLDFTNCFSFIMFYSRLVEVRYCHLMSSFMKVSKILKKELDNKTTL